ncbi:MAG TPA: endonuclease/exonuclease/phosphatase family protein [Sediminispirochaeta sp.]|nr:endonuclease/exonuclease/phosphatase family protein [Sediminispirochaeta sp.]
MKDSKKILVGALILAGPLFFISCTRCSFPLLADKPSDSESITVLSYNVQNLFDSSSDGTEYDDYDPSTGDWNEELFHLKLLQIAEVLGRFPEGGADIVLLQEVENRNALDQLRNHYLKASGYRYAAVTDAENSAVNNAVLSRYPIEEILVHSVSLEGRVGGRPIMEIEFDLGEENVRMLNCHWKSKAGGARETEEMRIAAAELVGRRMRELALAEVPALVAGDLNVNADEWERIDGAYPTALLPYGLRGEVRNWTHRPLYITGDFAESRSDGEATVLFSPWCSGERFSGSYAYQGQWQRIDHFLLNRTFDDQRGWEYADFEVIHDEALLRDDGLPKRWISDLGTGYSDHLPLLLRLERVE